MRVNDIKLSDFKPVPMLVSEQHIVSKPRFPAIDAHNHLTVSFASKNEPNTNWDHKELINTLDESGVEKIIDLTPFWGEKLRKVLDFHRPYKNRIVVFGGIDFSRIDDRDFASKIKETLTKDFQYGMRGIKIFKQLGLYYRDSSGKLIMPGDPRLKPVWDTAAELKIPVLIHVADPVAFFKPLDGTNERYEELCRHPDWHYYGKGLPSFKELIESGERLISANLDTTFILAHVGWYSENLGWVSEKLDKYPNIYVDISARISELGRQPYSSKKFFEKYADRIVFGTDLTPDVRMYRIYYRFLETEDEYFNYSTSDIPPQGRWYIYGLGLNDEILRKVYKENIEKIVNLNW